MVTDLLVWAGVIAAGVFAWALYATSPEREEHKRGGTERRAWTGDVARPQPESSAAAEDAGS